MSYELSFSPEFFLAEGEPYDSDEDYPAEKPRSVWQAIGCFFRDEPEQWTSMAKDVFELDAKHAKLLMAEAVLEKIQETNTCTNLRSPIEVWIDPEGVYRLKVWAK